MDRKVVSIFLLFAAFSITQAQNSCSDPNTRCVNVKQCEPFLKILTSPNRTPADIEYLRRSQCGFEGSDPLVCCPGQPGGSSSSNLLPSNCGNDISDRIVGGSVTQLGEFPWLVLLEYDSPSGLKLACGGVLINKRYVLTAAHCISSRDIPQNYRLRSIRFGEHDIMANPDCVPDGVSDFMCADEVVSVPIEQQIVHDGYNPSIDRRQDIALLRLARDVNPTSYIKPICLPTNSDISSKAIVAGWGQTEWRPQSDVKLKVTVPLVDRNTCQARYSSARITLGSGQICAGGEAGKDSCRGDSGGPLMQLIIAPDGTRRWAVVGIVSFGRTPCGIPGWPGVYTKVNDYMPWILSNLRP